MIYNNLRKINVIKGSKLQYTNKSKKPINQLKIYWKKNIITWEDSLNISSETIEKYELWVWKKISQKKNANIDSFNEYFYLYFFLHDNIQRNFIHYAPILNNNKLVAKLIKSDIILEINDQENRTPIDLAVNYLLLKLIKVYLSKKIIFKQSEAIFQKIITLYKIRTFDVNSFISLNSINAYYNLIKTLKLTILWAFRIIKQHQSYFYYKKPSQGFNYLTLFDGSFKWISNKLISKNIHFVFKFALIKKNKNLIISKRISSTSYSYLCKNVYNTNISSWIKKKISSNNTINQYTLKKSASLINSLNK